MGKEHSNEVVQVLAVVLIGFGYSYFFSFYRTSARELKRLGECYFLPDWTYLFLIPRIRCFAPLCPVLSFL